MATYYVIPCSAEKQTKAAPARDLYAGSMFKHTLAAALAQGDRVLVMSAKHGLVDLDTWLDTYEQRINQAGAVTDATLVAQAQQLGINWTDDVFGMLPAPYLRKLARALRTIDVYVLPVYETARGIGDQRHINKAIS